MRFLVEILIVGRPSGQRFCLIDNCRADPRPTLGKLGISNVGRPLVRQAAKTLAISSLQILLLMLGESQSLRRSLLWLRRL